MLPGWSVTTVDGHECDIFEPATPGADAVIYLHGVHQQRLVDDAVFAAEFSRHGLRVIAPQGGACWWVDRICPVWDQRFSPMDYLRTQIIGWIGERWRIAPPQVALLGTSMGGQGALRLSYLQPREFPVVAAISPAIDYQIRWREGDQILPLMYVDAEAVRQDTATLHIHPLNWPRHQWFACDPTDHRWYESAERLRMKLQALGVPHTCDLTTSGGGHGIEYYDRMAPSAVGFLAESLERVRRSLI